MKDDFKEASRQLHDLIRAFGLEDGINVAQMLGHTDAQRDNLLPKNMSPSKKAFETLGFKFKECEDELMYSATLPKGWKYIIGTGYYGKILDDQGRSRVTTFYKALPYDRDANMSLKRSIKIEIISVTSDLTTITITKAGKTLKQVGTASSPAEVDRLIEKAKAFLNQNFPEWNDPTKYWD